MKNLVVVTRHPALVEFLCELGMIELDTQILSHASEEDLQGKDVIGVLPLHLAAVAHTVTEIPLDLKPEDRGEELSLARLHEVAGKPRTFTVTRLA